MNHSGLEWNFVAFTISFLPFIPFSTWWSQVHSVLTPEKQKMYFVFRSVPCIFADRRYKTHFHETFLLFVVLFRWYAGLSYSLSAKKS